MKTIEWLAVEKYQGQQSLPAHKQIPAQNFIDWAQFGAREAQRWISITEELPNYGEPVLLKFVNGSYEVGYYLQHKERNDEFYSYIEPDIEFIFQAVTHWRPIERL
ncbi:DUF551 domain-containing protein [Parabacteroides sp. OttesenSCG-928-B22]|nr:DUF551 domain-containing protein [Parabacteroides sp. OttesenSCG-928-B22]